MVSPAFPVLVHSEIAGREEFPASLTTKDGVKISFPVGKAGLLLGANLVTKSGKAIAGLVTRTLTVAVAVPPFPSLIT